MLRGTQTILKRLTLNEVPSLVFQIFVDIIMLVSRTVFIEIEYTLVGIVQLFDSNLTANDSVCAVHSDPIGESLRERTCEVRRTANDILAVVSATGDTCRLTVRPGHNHVIVGECIILEGVL